MRAHSTPDWVREWLNPPAGALGERNSHCWQMKAKLELTGVSFLALPWQKCPFPSRFFATDLFSLAVSLPSHSTLHWGWFSDSTRPGADFCLTQDSNLLQLPCALSFGARI